LFDGNLTGENVCIHIFSFSIHWGDEKKNISEEKKITNAYDYITVRYTRKRVVPVDGGGEMRCI